MVDATRTQCLLVGKIKEESGETRLVVALPMLKDQEQTWRAYRVRLTDGGEVIVRMTTVDVAQQRGLRRQPHPTWVGKDVVKFTFGMSKVVLENLWESPLGSAIRKVRLAA